VLYWLTRRASVGRLVAPALSGVVALVALGWFVERVV